MTWTQPTSTRRTVLSVLGSGVAASLLGTNAAAQEAASGYSLVQGDSCLPVQPIRGTEPVTAFYDYGLSDQYVTDTADAPADGSAPYSSAGTTDLQRPQTSVAFLYRGPERLSLVVVHGRVGSDAGGAATFRISGLPGDGEWLVRDDVYRDPETGERGPTNHDDWDVDGTDHRIDWTWTEGRTDGGAFGGLGDEFEVVVHPAFGEAAAYHDEHYEGTVAEWEFLSGDDGGRRISLDTDDPITIATGRC